MINAANTATTGTAAVDSAGIKANKKLADDFDNFLLLLVTQLQNQDPLQPMETSEFTNQLVQFAGVEQAIATNSYLEKMLASQESNQNTAALSYLGKEVDASGNRTYLRDGNATFQYVNNQDYNRVIVTIQDASGTPIRSFESEAASGIQTIIWDGKDDNGMQRSEGFYRIRANGIDAEGNATPLNTIINGPVQSVGTENGQIMLTVNGTPISANEIISVREKSGT